MTVTPRPAQNTRYVEVAQPLVGAFCARMRCGVNAILIDAQFR